MIFNNQDGTHGAAGVGMALLFVLATTCVQAGDDVIQNLIVNGDFDTDLSGWTEEQDDSTNSFWASEDVDGSPDSGSLVATDLFSFFEPVGTAYAAWQCFDVDPAHHYRLEFSAKEERPTDGNIKIARVQVLDRTGEACPPGEENPRDISTFAISTLTLQPNSSSWTSGGTNMVIPQQTTRVIVATKACCATDRDPPFDDDDYGAYFDDILFGKIQTEISSQLDVPPGPFTPTETFDLEVDVTHEASSPADGLSVLVKHGGHLQLVGHTCPGTVKQTISAGDPVFHWDDIPTLDDGMTESCTITAEVDDGFAGTYTMQSQASCSDCNLAISQDDLNIDPAPEVAIFGFDVTPFPSAGEEIEVDFTLANFGTGSSTGSLSLLLSESLGAVDLVCEDFQLVQEDPVSFTAPLDIAPAEVQSCNLRFDTSPTFTGTVTMDLFAADATDYQQSNNESQATSQVVRLRTDVVLDGVDSDEGDGECADINDFCTFRAALMEANALPGRQVVEVPGSQFVHSLNVAGVGAGAGDVNITDEVLIRGEENNGFLPTIKADFPAGSEERVLKITAPPGDRIEIENVILMGQGTGVTQDGAVIGHFSGQFFLSDSIVRDGSTSGAGGGLFSTDSLALHNVEFLDNSAIFGGGIAWVPTGGGGRGMVDRDLSLNRVTLSGNGSTLVQSHGGGLWIDMNACSAGCDTIIQRSTIDNNQANHGGGIGIADMPDGGSGLLLNTSTVSTNYAYAEGGGFWLHDADIELSSSTLVFNEAGPGDPDTGLGGGIYLESGSNAILGNSIIAYNQAQLEGTPPFTTPFSAACRGTLDSGGFNSVQTTSVDTECTFVSTTGDFDIAVPDLGPLADNGGPTRTHALLSAGNEVDLGAPSAPACQSSDQRSYPRPVDGDTDGTPRCDKGAFELQSAPDFSLQCDGFVQVQNDGVVQTQCQAGSINGFAGQVGLSCSGVLPCQLSPMVLTPPADFDVGFAGNGEDAGEYEMTVSGTGAPGTRSVTITVTVTDPDILFRDGFEQ